MAKKKSFDESTPDELTPEILQQQTAEQKKKAPFKCKNRYGAIIESGNELGQFDLTQEIGRNYGNNHF